MKSIKTFYLIIFCLILCFGIKDSAYGDERKIYVFVGNTKIAIEVPPDFVEVPRNASPELWKIAENWTTNTKELLALIVEKDVIDSSTKKSTASKKYLLVQAPRQYKNVKLTDEDFDQFKKDLKQSQYTTEETEEKTEKKMKMKIKRKRDEDKSEESVKVPKNLLAEFKDPNRLESGSFPLGFFHETANSIGNVVLIKQILGGHGQKAAYFTVVATNVVFLRGKLFFLYVIKEYQSQSDSDWVKIMSEHWVNTTIGFNPVKKVAKPKPIPNTEKKSVIKDLPQKQGGNIKIFFKNGRSMVCDKVWREGGSIFVIGKGKKYAVSYADGEIDMEKSFGNK
jgi:hypothetical protein